VSTTKKRALNGEESTPSHVRWRARNGVPASGFGLPFGLLPHPGFSYYPASFATPSRHDKSFSENGLRSPDESRHLISFRGAWY